jgi:hypothetical protein
MGPVVLGGGDGGGGGHRGGVELLSAAGPAGGALLTAAVLEEGSEMGMMEVAELCEAFAELAKRRPEAVELTARKLAAWMRWEAKRAA